MPAQTPIHASTQEHLDIIDIQDDLVLLKNNSCCLVLKTTAINFSLLSEREQEATIFAYAGCLNSLTFPLQILIRSRQKDISSYLGLIDQHLYQQKNEKLKIQTQKYRQFVESTVKKNKVLDKKFYLVLPFTSVQLKKTKQKGLLEKAKADLFPKRDHLIGQLQRLGLKAKQLTNQELIELFYHIYNPTGEGQKFVSSQEYAASLVQSKVKPAAPSAAPNKIRAAGIAYGAARPTPPPSSPPPPQKTKPKIPPPPTSLNMMKPQKIESQVLEGQKLQNKIEDIVAKTKKYQE